MNLPDSARDFSLINRSLSSDHIASLYRVANLHKTFLERIKESFVREVLRE